MKAALKAKWIKALTSGEYKQTQETLYRITDKNEHQFCCLGVLADIAIEAPWRRANGGSGYTFAGNDTNTAILSDNVCRRVGLSPEQQLALTIRNDHGWSFTQLAKYIEENI